MLKELNHDQAEFVAVLAKSVRAQRDSSIAEVAEADFAEPKSARGEHNPTAQLGFVTPEDATQFTRLREAVDSLTPAGRSELYALMRLGQGDLAAKKWHRGLTEAAALGDDTVTAALLEDPDLHDHLMKGLYETK
ncbi:MAG: DUF3775 domain-containing protein [Bradyrhizobiaceae bacterium]|nr:DUF3775 domain-containing protein [Bradyrhizobiaceae bacterium]